MRTFFNISFSAVTRRAAKQKKNWPQINADFHRGAGVVTALASSAATTICSLAKAQLWSSFPRQCRFFSGTARSIVRGRGIFRSTVSHRANRPVRKFRDAIASQLAYPDNHLSLFRKRWPCPRRWHRPRRSHSNRRRTRSSGRNRKRTSCSGRSAERLFRESGWTSRRNRKDHFPDADRARRDRARRKQTAADK